MAFCFDTDVMSAAIRPDPPIRLIRRLAAVPRDQQFTTSITVGELIYGVAKKHSESLAGRVREITNRATAVLPFDRAAARVYGPLRAHLETEGKRLDEADLRIASIALVADLTLVTGNVKHFSRVPGLRVENWLEQ